MKTKRRISLLAVLICVFALVFSLGIMSACGDSSANTENSETAGGNWYYGNAEPAAGLGNSGDYYLNTETLASYVKDGAQWMAVDATKAGNWYYGTNAPENTLGAEGDFYLNTASGELYHRGADSWGEPVLVLKGTNGRDGVLWFSGDKDPNEYDESDTAVKDATAGDFYLDYSTFNVYQRQTDGSWKELGSLKGTDGVTPKLEGFLTGAGNPTYAGLVVENGNFYLDTETGEIYKATVLEGATSWSKVGTLNDRNSAGYLVSIHYGSLTNAKGWVMRECDDDPNIYVDSYYAQFWRNTIDELGGGWYLNVSKNDSNVYGYWFYFADNTVYWLQTDHEHDYTDAETATVYNKDCEKGTVQFKKCTGCGEWAIFVTAADKVGPVQHKYDTEVWRFNETQHWHEITCVHKDLGNKDVNDHDFFTYATVKWDGESPVTTPSYEYWKECSVCGYKEKVVTKESLEQDDGIVHIKTTNDWNAVAKLIAEAEDTSDWKIQLDADLDFKGAEIKPMGMPTNADQLVKLDEIGYALDTAQPIEGGFKGDFDGQNHSISNFTINGAHFAGLFACLNGGTVKDLKINGTVTRETEGKFVGRFVSSSTNIKGDAFVGAVAGLITGTEVSITNVTVTDVVLVGNRHVGGIAGYAYKAGPVISTNSVGADVQAAIKNCVVKGSESVRNSWNLPLMVYSDYADGTQDYYWNGANLGGILGTAIASSVIGCEVEYLSLQGCANTNFIVGYAEGIDNSNRTAVVSNKAYTGTLSHSRLMALEGKDNEAATTITDYKKLKAYSATIQNNGKLMQKGNYVIDSLNEQPNSRAARFQEATPAFVGEELDIYTFEDLEAFARRVNGTDEEPGESFANGTINIMDDIDMSGSVWTPINAFNRQLAGATIQGFSAAEPAKLTGMFFTNTGETTDYTYGLGFISSVAGSLTMQNLVFEKAVVTASTETVTGNVIGVVCGYVYSTTTFRNITVQNCEVYGYGKVGGIVGMGADPGVEITFDGCKSLNNHFYGVYNVGGFAGNIQRGYDGKDKTVFVPDSGNLSDGNTYALLDNKVQLDVEAEFSMTDREGGQLYRQKVTGTYVLLSGIYYFGGSAEYYISYGSGTYDPPILTEDFTNYRIADSEICMNDPVTYEHSGEPIEPAVPEA